LRNNNNYCRIFKFSKKLFFWHETALNFFLFCLSNFLIFLSMNANYFSVDSVPSPIKMNLISSMFFVKFFTKRLIFNDSMKCFFNSICLLFDELHCVGKKNNFFLLSVGKIVIHWSYGNTGFSKTCRKINDWVPVLTFLEKSLLIISKTNFNVRSISVFYQWKLWFVFFLIIKLIFFFIFLVKKLSNNLIFFFRGFWWFVILVNDFIFIFKDALIIGFFFCWDVFF